VAAVSDGRVFGWGLNASGQLGTGAARRQKTAVPVLGATNVVSLAAGSSHVLAVRSDGTVLAWGSNANGQLGDNSNIDRITPIVVPGLTDIVKVEATFSKSFAVRSDGTLFAWGYNGFGQLGVGSSESYIKQPTPVLDVTNVVDVDAGDGHVLALRSDGKVFSWGSNSDGQLGDPSLAETYAGIDRPHEVPNLADVKDIEAGGSASVVVNAVGEMYLFGQTNYWVEPYKSSNPIMVQSIPPVAKATVGQYATMAVINAPMPFWTSVTPNSVVGGYGSGELTIHTEEAPSENSVFSLASSSELVSVPGLITLPAGQTSVTVPFSASTLTSTPTSVRLSGEHGGIAMYAQVYVDIRRMQLLGSTEIQAGDATTGTVRTNFPAPKNGLVVNLVASKPDRVAVPATVTIPEGSTQASFHIQTLPSLTNDYVLIDGKQNARTAQMNLIIKGTWLTSLSLDKTEVIGGGAVKATVIFPESTPAGGLKLQLLPWPEDLGVVEFKKVPEGQTTTTFRIVTYPVKEPTEAAITVVAPNSYPRWKYFRILPPTLTTATFTPASVKGGTSSVAKITLNGASAGETVSLYTTSAAVNLPSGIEIAAGEKEASINIPTNTVTVNTPVWVRFRLRDKTIWTKLTVTP
jgi:hypothetical protein